MNHQTNPETDFSRLFSADLGVDLGSAFVRVISGKTRAIYSEPSIVAKASVGLKRRVTARV